MISHPHRCIFIHIPKNGGASIERLIWSESDRTEENLWMGFVSSQQNKYQTGALQHLFASNVIKAVSKEVYEEYFTFSMVRNPWDRAVSQFIYLHRRPDLQRFLGADHRTSFPEYLELIVQKPHVHWQPQYLFLTDAAGQSIVDYVGRFEEYEASVKEMMVKVCGKPERPDGSPLNIPHVNKSSRDNYWMYYENQTIDTVAKIYQEDIQRYGYSFEDNAYHGRTRKLPFPVSHANPNSVLRRLARKVKRNLPW
jgi:hypothetical protein